MSNVFHGEIVKLIRKTAGKPAPDEFLKSYLGNPHPRYHIDNPTLRTILRGWMRDHRHLDADTFAEVLDSLIKGETSTEKISAGILLSYSAKSQREFNPMLFDPWLDHLIGWAEVDHLCTGDFMATQMVPDWPEWKKVVQKLSLSSNINKRRASLVLFCSPLARDKNDTIAASALENISRLKAEKHIMITKAISWVLRSMTKHHREAVSEYLHDNADTLPRIAVRETIAKLKTGRKTRRPIT